MTYIRRISDSIPITVPQEPEISSQSQAQPEANLGVASGTDLFETPASNNSIFIDPQTQSAALMAPDTTQNEIVDASSIFSYFESSAGQLNARSAELAERLKALNERKKELASQMIDMKNEILKVGEAVQAIRAARAEGRPIPDSVISTLGALGTLALVGGLPALPIIGGVLGMFGLSVDYKNKMDRMAAELEKKMGEMGLNLESLQSELEELNKETDIVRGEVAHEELKRQKEIAPMQENSMSNSMIQEQAWQQFNPDQNVIQNQSDPLISTLNLVDLDKKE